MRMTIEHIKRWNVWRKHNWFDRHFCETYKAEIEPQESEVEEHKHE